MGSAARRPVLRVLLVGGAVVALLGACQTGTDPGDDEGTASQTQATSAEPTQTTTPPAAPENSAGPVVNGSNSIASPAPHETVTGPAVTVTGEGTAFEATLNYQVLVAGTTEVVLGPDYTMAGANGEVGPYTIELTLDPGEYTVQVWEPDMSDGEAPDGPYRNLVEVTFTVS